MWWLMGLFYRYRNEIIFAVQMAALLRKTAKQIAQDYLRKKIRETLYRSIGIQIFQLILLGLALLLSVSPSHTAQWSSTLVLWTVTFYNLGQFFFFTIPETLRVRKMLKTKTGYAFKYVLQVSLWSELMRGSLLFLLLCLLFLFLSRWYLGGQLKYFPLP